jgi:uncharacterized protein (DUF2336 family)
MKRSPCGFYRRRLRINVAVTKSSLYMGMSAVQGVIDQLEYSLQSGSSSQRLQMLRSVTELYLQGASSHTVETVELFDQALNRLVDYVETQALARLSSQLAPIANAPLRLVQRLARNDEIEVSEPLLRESTQLAAADLIEIASTKSQSHLAAIGGRAQLDEAVTDVLVTKGDAAVARIVAGNGGARFSDRGFSTLVTRAEAEVGLAEIVSIRAEMSPRHFRQLLLRATDTVRCRLMAISDPRTHAKIKRIVSQIAREVERAAAAPERDYAAAETLVNSIGADTRLLQEKLTEFATKMRFEETVACLAVLGELSVTAVETILTQNDDGGILLLCKGIGLDWPTAGSILSLSSSAGGARATEESSARFERISSSTAERVLRFWRVRMSAAGPRTIFEAGVLAK